MTKDDLVFIVDDDPVFSDVLKFFLLDKGFENIEIYDNGSEYINNLFKLPKLVLQDYNVSDKSGKELLEHTLSFDPDIIVVVVSSQQDVELAVETMRLGAFDYLIKNEDLNDKLVKILDVVTELNLRIDQFKKKTRNKFIAVIGASIVIAGIILLNNYLNH